LCIVRSMRKLALAAALSVSTAFGGAAAYANDNVYVRAESLDALVEFSVERGKVGFVYYAEDNSEGHLRAQAIAKRMFEMGGGMFHEPQYIISLPFEGAQAGAILTVNSNGIGRVLTPAQVLNDDEIFATLLADSPQKSNEREARLARMQDVGERLEAHIECLEDGGDVLDCQLRYGD
ncbi:MAG: hypothetical protein ACRBCT_09660, partial [Alphaproteobacteria bacterium]